MTIVEEEIEGERSREKTDRAVRYVKIGYGRTKGQESSGRGMRDDCREFSGKKSEV